MACTANPEMAETFPRMPNQDRNPPIGPPGVCRKVPRTAQAISASQNPHELTHWDGGGILNPMDPPLQAAKGKIRLHRTVEHSQLDISNAQALMSCTPKWTPGRDARNRPRSFASTTKSGSPPQSVLASARTISKRSSNKSKTTLESRSPWSSGRSLHGLALTAETSRPAHPRNPGAVSAYTSA